MKKSHIIHCWTAHLSSSSLIHSKNPDNLNSICIPLEIIPIFSSFLEWDVISLPSLRNIPRLISVLHVLSVVSSIHQPGTLVLLVGTSVYHHDLRHGGVKRHWLWCHRWCQCNVVKLAGLKGPAPNLWRQWMEPISWCQLYWISHWEALRRINE